MTTSAEYLYYTKYLHDTEDFDHRSTTEYQVEATTSESSGLTTTASKNDTNTGFNKSQAVKKTVGVALGATVAVACLVAVVAIQCVVIAKYRRERRGESSQNDLLTSTAPLRSLTQQDEPRDGDEYAYAVVRETTSLERTLESRGVAGEEGSITLQNNEAYSSVSVNLSSVRGEGGERGKSDFSTSLPSLHTGSVDVLLTPNLEEGRESGNYEPLYF